MTVKLKRAYDAPADQDGYRVLVDRLWPRGVAKAKAKIDLWLKDVAPSTELRKWFAHDPEKWAEFKKKYAEELKKNPAWDELKSLAKGKSITLIYAAKDEVHNEAAYLKQRLDRGKPHA